MAWHDSDTHKKKRIRKKKEDDKKKSDPLTLTPF